jgi:hypothetical protein
MSDSEEELPPLPPPPPASAYVVSLDTAAPCAVGEAARFSVAPADDVVKPGPIQWEVALAPGRWAPVPAYAKPFPWDPQSFTPVADLLGAEIRAVVILMHDATETPLCDDVEVADDATGEVVRKRRVRKYVTAAARVGLTDKLKQTALKAAAMPKFGCHAMAADSNSRLVVALTPLPALPSGRAAILRVEAMAVPDDDGAAMACVFRGDVVAADAPVCTLGLADEVTLTLQTDRALPLAGDAADGDAAGAAFEDAPARRVLEVVVRTRADRDMIALCIRRVHAKTFGLVA